MNEPSEFEPLHSTAVRDEAILDISEQNDISICMHVALMPTKFQCNPRCGSGGYHLKNFKMAA